MAGNNSNKLKPTLMLEQNYTGPVCGIDEAGRGPLAGPVVAACVFIPEGMRRKHFLRSVNDSKKLTAKVRSELYVEIKEFCIFGVGIASPEDIDELNIHHATLLAMKRSYETMCADFGTVPEAALVDGKFSPKIQCSCQTVVKGDSVSLSIAAASILAKVTRDGIMAQLHADHPVYGWERNAGYGTAEHLDALRLHGVTPYHRRTFAPVRNILQAA